MVVIQAPSAASVPGVMPWPPGSARGHVGPRVLDEVGPGAVQQLARDHGVGVALGDEHVRPDEVTRRRRQAGIERQRAVEDRRSRPAIRVVEQEAAREGRSTAEADEQHGALRGRGLDQPPAEPVHRRAQRLRHRASDAAVGEPREAAALRDRRAHRGVRRTRGQVGGQGEDLALVRPAAVQQDHERRGRGVGPRRRNDDRAERAHEVGSIGRSSSAVRTPVHVWSSPRRSRGSIGAELSNSPQPARGSIHCTSNSCPSGSCP